MKKAKVDICGKLKEFEIIEEPYPHVVINTKKELHGWWKGKRECTGERLLINPYNGCSIDCIFCYVKGFSWSYFKLFFEEKVVSVCWDFDKIVAEQLDSINVASCGYLSPVTDPFQDINSKYNLSEKIIEVFIERNIPIEFVTKQIIPDRAIELIKTQIHSFGQVSILTQNDDLRKLFVPGGASTKDLFENLERLASKGIFAVCRIDPIFPYLTDKKMDLLDLIKRAKDSGAKHIVASSLDIPKSIYSHIIDRFSIFGTSVVYDYKRLYTEPIDAYYNAKIDYRKKLFSFLRETCDSLGLSFALCMEYELLDGKAIGLNKEFANTKNCEGIDIPIYIRDGKKFRPASSCDGACLNCKEAICGIEDLAMAKNPDSKKDFKLNDYKRWSKKLEFTYMLK
ncbi:TPA: hypothetical protein DCX16_04070 [bacterium]|nr:hypothetical protein [bacterium]